MHFQFANIRGDLLWQYVVAEPANQPVGKCKKTPENLHARAIESESG